MRRSSYEGYTKLAGYVIAFLAILVAAAFYAVCFVAIQFSIWFGGVCQEGASQRTDSRADAVAVGLVTCFAWAFLTFVIVGLTIAVPAGLIAGVAVGLVVGWQVGKGQEAVSWSRSPGALRLGTVRQGRFYVTRPYSVTGLERTKHLVCTGPTGAGKSTLLQNLILQDMEAGAGVCVIDPKDDLVDRLLGHVPSERVDDVILFDATDTERPLGLNPFAGVPAQQRSLAAAEILAVFRRYFSDAWGARLEHILRNVVLALLEVPDATLADVPRLLLDPAYCQYVVSKVSNQAVREFFLVEYEQVLRRRSDAIEPILNKVGPWLVYPELRNIIGQPTNSFDFRRVMDEGKLLFVRIPQGALGEDVSNLLGALIVAKVQLAAQSRVDVSPERRRRFYLYVDEFQNFATSSFAKVLTEARAFGLGLVCSNQYPEQLSRDLQLALTRNAATFVETVYRRGRYELLVGRQEDREDKETEPWVVKPAGSLGPGDRQRAAEIRTTSRERYGRVVTDLFSMPMRATTAGSAPAKNGQRADPAWGHDVEED
jgi:energy-coupling factor transporter ATP-binding protein EcfA2